MSLLAFIVLSSLINGQHSFRLPPLPRHQLLSQRHTSTPKAFKWYLERLSTNPVLTKGLTTGIIEVLGDGVAQITEKGNIYPTRSSKSKRKRGLWEFRRSLGCLVDGIFISGPLLHFTYDYLEKLFPSYGGPLWATFAQVFIDEFICDPIDVAIYLTATSLIEGKEVRPTLRNKYWSTLREGMLTSLALCPIQFISFRYLPLKTRVLVVNVCDFIWMAIVSFSAHNNRQVKQVAKL